MESGRALVKCEQHGLHYDQNLHAGCVVCRRSNSLPPKGPASLRSPAASVPPGTSVPPGGSAAIQFAPAPPVTEAPPRVMPIVRLLLASGVLFLIGRLACRYSFNTRQAASDVLSTVLAIVTLALIPMAVRRYRSLAAFSWLLLITTGLFLISSFQQLVRPQPEKEVEEWQMTEWRSDDGLVTLKVPGTWVSQTGGRQVGDLSLDLASMRANFAIVEMHEAVSNLPVTADMQTYLSAVKRIYAERHSATFGATEEAKVAGFRGLKVPVDCKLKDLPARGFVFVTRSATHFHMFFVATDPGYAQHLVALERWVEQGQIRNGA